MEKPFLAEAFFVALDAHRHAKKLTWKKVAEKAQVSASTLTRIAQGKRPDVDTLAALCLWSGLDADEFFASRGDQVEKPEPLAQMMVQLRADRNLSPEGKKAIEVMLKTTYEQFRVE